MQKTAEAVSIGHPDKISDYISSYVLDRLIERNPMVRYAVEVLIKNNTIIFGGEVSDNLSSESLKQYAIDALSEIGYTKDYAKIWGKYAIEPAKIEVINLVGQQSEEINQGVQQDGWGDQGVFVGYACQGENLINRELYLARKLNKILYEYAKKSDNLGLDIKTQITLNDNRIETVVVAIPMLKHIDLTDFIIQKLGEKPKNIIVNGTGNYMMHSSIADCGVSGRKLACDFYSTACPIGGGSPWTKDASKADLTLNLYARKLAVNNLKDNDESFVYLASCIGKAELPSALFKTIKDKKEKLKNVKITQTPSEIIKELNLRTPCFTQLCQSGIGACFGGLLKDI